MLCHKKGMKDTTNTKKNLEENLENQGPKPAEFGGPKGPEPTRFGDWEQKGRCTDF